MESLSLIKLMLWSTLVALGLVLAMLAVVGDWRVAAAGGAMWQAVVAATVLLSRR